jgi:N-acetyltransferase
MAFELQPMLEGELVRLRPLREEDWGALFAVAADPLIWEQHPEADRWKEPVFRRFFDGAMASGGALVVLEEGMGPGGDGQVIGSSRYFGLDVERSEVEIGWSFVARRFWGRGYNPEMKRLMITHAFRFVERVVFIVGPGNVRSQMALQKIGAVREGGLVRVEEHGREVERVRFVMERETSTWDGPGMD